MIDHIALALSHLLLAIAGWRLLLRGDLDAEPEDRSEAAASREPRSGA
jgi:hypothetical protein